MAASDRTGRFERDYPVGHVLFEQDEPGSRMFIIQSGQVRIYRSSDGEEVLLALLGPGEFFGEMALLEGLPRSASARVEKDARVVEVDAEVFSDMVRNNTEIAVRLLKKLSARVRELDRRVQHLYADQGTGRALEVLGFLLPAEDDREVRVTEAKLLGVFQDRAGLAAWQAGAVVEELRSAKLLRPARGPDGRACFIVAARVRLNDYQRYLELRRKYDTARREIGDLADRGVQRLWRALQTEDDELVRNQTMLARHFQDYLQLKSEFGGEPLP